MAETASNGQDKQGGGCFQLFKRFRGEKYKPTIYDQWGSYESEPGVRCNGFCKPHDSSLLLTPPNKPEVDTVWRLWQCGVERSPDSNCLGWRSGSSYSWHSYQDAADKILKISSGLATLGLRRQDKVGIYSQSKPEWMMAALALASQSLIIVPLYDTLGVESCSYIISQVEMTVLFVDTAAAAKKILENSTAAGLLKTVIIFDKPDEATVGLAAKQNITLTLLSDFEQSSPSSNGKENEAYEPDQPSESKGTPSAPSTSELPTADDVFIIMFTSGTTGNPKGVVHTNRAFVADCVGVDSLFHTDYGKCNCFSSKDVALQYLPLAHAYGLALCIWFLFRGASIGFFGGNVLKLMEDAEVLKPTYVPMVPRLMNRIYTRVLTTLEKSPLKAKLFWYGYRRKKADMLRGVVTRTSLWDKLIFNKIQKLLGGRVWLMTVGSAPVSAEVLEFCRVVFGAMVMEGYGQTECTAVASVAIGPVGGNVGHPLPCNCIKLDDVPDCGYFAKEGKGEICIKGPNVMVEYFKQPEKTAETVDADRWLHTGDIGEFLPDGSFRIIDRKKNIFKLAQGEYIAPEKIENVYALCPKVLQVYVDGDSLEAYAVAVVVPEPTMAAAHASTKGVSLLELMTNEEFVKMMFDAIITVGKENKLNSLEQVKSIALVSEPFTIDNGLLTPTLKNKRPELRKFFQETIKALYQAGPLASGGPSSSK